jgi:hypothetical protein
MEATYSAETAVDFQWTTLIAEASGQLPTLKMEAT